MTGLKAPHLRLSPGVYLCVCVCVCACMWVWKRRFNTPEREIPRMYLFMYAKIYWNGRECVMEKYPKNVREPQMAQKEQERGRCRVLKGADEAGVRLQARSGHRCGRRVKLSSHYHADTQANNGGSICSCQPLQIWCHPVRWRQQATASNQTAQAPPACKSSHRLHTHSLSG